MTRKASGKVQAVHASSAGSAASVDVLSWGALYERVRYPAWYTPQVGDVVVVDWLGTQPYVSTCFF